MLSSDVDIYNMESVLILMTDAATDQFHSVVVYPILFAVDVCIFICVVYI